MPSPAYSKSRDFSKIAPMDIFGFTIPALMFWKLVGLAVLAFVVNFIYTFKTGRSLTDDRNQMQRQQGHASTPAKQGKEGP